MKIGRMVRQDLRTIWPREDVDFTPWLASPENLELLAETLGLGELDRVEEEVSVGSFSADIVCRDMADQIVVIENQIEKSDHTHLGQVLTYLAGTDARTIVWIAKVLREEHRAALDWLNVNTSTEFAFFGVEIQAWCIGDSEPAPQFEIVCRPNDWARQQKQKTRAAVSEDYQRRMEYWNAFLSNWTGIEGISPPRTGPNQGWMKLALTGPNRLLDSGAGIYLYRLLDKGRVGVYLSIGKREPDRFSEWSETLDQFKSLSGGVWDVNRNGLIQYFHTFDADAMNEGDWFRQHEWMRQKVHDFIEDWQNGLKESVEELVAREGSKSNEE